MRRGKFVVIDGMDGVGKGVIEKALVEFCDGEVFDSVDWSLKNAMVRPGFDLVDGRGFSCVLTAEPTYTLLGADIRWELNSKSHDRSYSSESLIHAYSLDREIQMKRFVVPVLESGVDVIQSRCFAASCCYEMIVAEDEGKDVDEVLSYILKQVGNRFQIENAPDLLIIPTVENVEELIARINAREKDDDAIFENMKFQERVKVLYKGKWLRDIFERAGTKVAYLDAGISVESTRRQAVEIYSEFLSSGKVLEKYSGVS